MAIDACSRPVESLRIEVPAAPDQLAGIRHRLAGWLEPIGVSNTGIADIVLVVNEACTNCIEHAYRDIDAGPMCVEASHTRGKIIVNIADRGIWQPPPSKPTTRGRGLLIMQAVSADVDVTSSSDGTTVQLTFDAAP